jgi:ferritin
VSSWINDFLTAARNENDHASDIFLQWFVTEQVEEEQSASNITQQMKLIGDSANALLMLDRELGTRVFTMPLPTE